MTERKPPNVSTGDWIDQQIRTAQARGDFDNLPGAGKPIPDLGQRQSSLDWVAKLARRERLEAGAMLPPSLALPKEIEDLPARLAAESSETRVRTLIADLNDRIRRAHQRPQSGPPLRVMPVDEAAVLQRWRDDRARALAAHRARAAELAEAAPEPATRRPGPWRRWLTRRRDPARPADPAGPDAG